MRTTLTIEDHIMNDLKAIAHESGRSLKEVVNDTLRAGLSGTGEIAAPYRVTPVNLGGPRDGIDLDKALALSEALEDEELARKLDLRK